MTHVGVNGALVPAGEVRVDPLDLGLHRGLAVFDYFPVRAGEAWFLRDYLKRFTRSARAMGLVEGLLPVAALAAHLRQLAEANELRHGGCKLLLTGGGSVDGYTPQAPTLYTYALPQTPPHPTAPAAGTGIRVLLLDHARETPAVKTTNYAAAMRHYATMRAAGASEVVYHRGGYVTEASRSNVLCVTEAEQVWVPPTDSALPGVTRLHTIAAARELGYTVLERSLPVDRLLAAREVAITGSSKGVTAVTTVASQVIGAGLPGPLTAALADAYVSRGRARAGWVV